MQERLTTSSIFHSKQTWLLFSLYASIRILSYFLAGNVIAQAGIVFLVVSIMGLVFFKNPDHAWMMVVGELILGGSGHFFEFYGLSLRTILILVFLFLWIIYIIANRFERETHILPHKLFYLIIVFFGFLAVSVVTGLFNNHSVTAIIQDFIPFAFLLLVHPAYHLFSQDHMRHYLVRLIIVFLIGSALFSLFTYILFVSGTAELQGPLYHWFRDIAVGKITEVTTYYYRIVLAENLLITPILLVISSLLMRDEKHHKMWRVLFLCGAVILALNFSRAYLLAFAVGLLFLKYKHKVLRWFIVSAWSVAMIVLIFMSILIISSKGKSFGFEIIGIRISSLIQPITETSSNIRMALLEPIETLILQHPIIGNGLGSTFTYIDPRTYTEVTTSQFDWGYLEMWAELGIGGALCLLTIVGFLIYELIKKIRSISDYHDLYVGLLGGVIALLVMNITSPALYHVLGIFFLTFIIAFASKADGLFDETVTLLYRVFNRLKVHPDSKLR